MPEGEAVNVGAKILSGGIWRTLSYAVATLAAVISTAVVSRSIGPAGLAEYATALSLVTVALGFSDFGLLALGIREFTSLEGEDRERHFRVLTTMRLVTSGMAALVITLVAALSDVSGDVFRGVIAAAVAVFVLALYASYCVPLQATYRFTAMALLDGARQLIWSAILIVVALAGGSVGLIIAALLPAAIVVALAAALLVRRTVSIKPMWDPATMRKLLGAVGTFAVAASVGSVYAFIAQVASDAVLSSHDSGQFALAFRVFVTILTAGVIAVIGAFPLLVSSAADDLDRLAFATRRMWQTALLAGLGCAVGLVAAGSLVVKILGGSDYADSVQALAIIGFALPGSFVLAAGSNVLLAVGRHRELVAIATIGALISILLTVVLASRYSSNGAAAGIVIGETLLAAAYVTSVRRIERKSLPRAGWTAAVLLVATVACAVAAIGLPVLVSTALALAVYVGGLLLLGLTPPELTDKVRAVWPGSRFV